MLNATKSLADLFAPPSSFGSLIRANFTNVFGFCPSMLGLPDDG